MHLPFLDMARESFLTQMVTGLKASLTAEKRNMEDLNLVMLLVFTRASGPIISTTDGESSSLATKSLMGSFMMVFSSSRLSKVAQAIAHTMRIVL